jgi:hypothetical protein
MAGTALVLLQLWFILFGPKWTTYITGSTDGLLIIPDVGNHSSMDRIDATSHDTRTPILKRRTYHSWGPEGIDLKHVLRYINETYYDNVTWSKPVRSYQPFPSVCYRLEQDTHYFGASQYSSSNSGRGCQSVANDAAALSAGITD